MAVVVVIFLALLGLACLAAVALNLPGLWVYLAFAGLLELADGLWGVETTVGWWALGIALVLALIGEAVEALSGLLGAKVAKGTRRGAIGSLIGAITGGIAFSFLLPIPVLGSIVGVVVGTFVGALVGELTGPQAKEIGAAWKPALAATIARLLGTAFKVAVSTLAWMLCTAASVYNLGGPLSDP